MGCVRGGAHSCKQEELQMFYIIVQTLTALARKFIALPVERAVVGAYD